MLYFSFNLKTQRTRYRCFEYGRGIIRILLFFFKKAFGSGRHSDVNLHIFKLQRRLTTDSL